MMTATDQNKKTKRLIHVGIIEEKKGKLKYLFLREINPNLFQWSKNDVSKLEIETDVFGITIEEAISKANSSFKDQSFRSLNCGFRYTLPERDEHGINAYFFQMNASYASSNGVYFDEILGNNCFVQFASIDALKLRDLLKQENRL